MFFFHRKEAIQISNFTLVSFTLLWLGLAMVPKVAILKRTKVDLKRSLAELDHIVQLIVLFFSTESHSWDVEIWQIFVLILSFPRCESTTVQDMSDGSGGNRGTRARGEQRPARCQSSRTPTSSWDPATREATPPRVGEAVHAPPNFKGRGASGPARGGAAIFGTSPGARLNTIKVSSQVFFNFVIKRKLEENFGKNQL